MKERSAQAWGFDLIVGSVIFIAGLIFLYIYTINYPNGEDDTLQVLQREAELISGVLLTEGSPIAWNETNVERIGLISDGKINNTKLQYFRNLADNDYNATKRLFKLKDEYFVFFDNKQTSGIGMNAGSPENLVKVTRVVVYNNNITTMNVYVWN